MTRNERLRTIEPQRILLIKPSALGDIMHSLPTLAALRNRFPQAHLTWLVNRIYEPLLRDHPDLDATLPFDRHLFRGGVFKGFGLARSFVRDLRSRKFELAIDLQGLFRTGLLARASGAKVRLGLTSAREGAAWFYTHIIEDREPGLHAVERYWKTALALGAGDGEKTFQLPLPTDAIAWAKATLADAPRPWLTVGVGARWLTKRWLPQHFAELVRRAQQRFGGTALFIGTPDERPLAEEAARLVGSTTRVFAGETSLAQLAALLAVADVVLANDTGPLHLAVALGRPVVAPYTCTHVAKTGPFGQHHRAVETKVWCHGSEIKKCSRLECMAELTPDRLWPALAEILENLGQPTSVS